MAKFLKDIWMFDFKKSMIVSLKILFRLNIFYCNNIWFCLFPNIFVVLNCLKIELLLNRQFLYGKIFINAYTLKIWNTYRWMYQPIKKALKDVLILANLSFFFVIFPRLLSLYWLAFKKFNLWLHFCMKISRIKVSQWARGS